MANSDIEKAEEVLRGIVKAYGTETTLTALHNIYCFGSAFNQADETVPDSTVKFTVETISELKNHVVDNIA